MTDPYGQPMQAPPMRTEDALREALQQLSVSKYAFLKCKTKREARLLRGRLYSAAMVRGMFWNFSISGTEVVIWK